jgi:uncharacterized delta-60 repeat protein
MTLHQLSIRHYRGAAFAASLCGAFRLLAQVPFELDTDYRTTIEARNVNAVHLLPDGKLFLSGQIRYPGEGLTFRGSMRLLFDGERDPLFQSFPFSTGGGPIMPWNDGKFYVQAGGVVRRLHPDGAIDQSFAFFGDDPYVSPSNVGGYHVFPDGRVVTSGDHILSDVGRGFVGQYNWVWFTNTGRLDTTRIHRQANFPTGRFAALPNGQFICHGQGSSFDGQPVDKLFKLNADGSVDTSFQSGVYWGVVFSYMPLSDGRVYVGGRYQCSQWGSDTLALARFLQDGTLDPSFQPPVLGAGELDPITGLTITSITPLDPNKLLVTGRFQTVNGQPRRGVCLLDSTGAVLDAFNNAGVGDYVYMGISYGYVVSALVDTTNNHLYLCGPFNGYSDGTTSDPTQRFVTRLHLGDIMTSSPVERRMDEARGLRVFPNPSNGLVRIEVDAAMNERAELILRDVTGRVVHRGQLVAHRSTVHLDLPVGLYHIFVHDINGVLSASLAIE